jgi:hypothetical protein
VEEDIARVRSSLAFSNRMWRMGGKFGDKLYAELFRRNFVRCREHLRRGENAEVKLYVDALGRIGTAMGLDSHIHIPRTDAKPRRTRACGGIRGQMIGCFLLLFNFLLLQPQRFIDNAEKFIVVVQPAETKPVCPFGRCA